MKMKSLVIISSLVIIAISCIGAVSAAQISSDNGLMFNFERYSGSVLIDLKAYDANDTLIINDLSRVYSGNNNYCVFLPEITTRIETNASMFFGEYNLFNKFNLNPPLFRYNLTGDITVNLTSNDDGSYFYYQGNYYYIVQGNIITQDSAQSWIASSLQYVLPSHFIDLTGRLIGGGISNSEGSNFSVNFSVNNSNFGNHTGGGI
jgi:hypothetical protein